MAAPDQLAEITDPLVTREPSIHGSRTRSNEFCLEALEEALARHGRPEIFNTDQGSQFTSPRFTRVLLDAAVKISMDGRGRWMDNVMIERLNYECVYLHAFETGSAARAGIGKWIVRPLSRTGGVRGLTLQHPAPPFGAWRKDTDRGPSGPRPEGGGMINRQA